MQLFIQPIIHFSHACSIQEDNRVIITGGHSTKTVSVYDEYGWREDLPSLNEGRMGHACTSFISGGKKVDMLMLRDHGHMSTCYFGPLRTRYLLCHAYFC